MSTLGNKNKMEAPSQAHLTSAYYAAGMCVQQPLSGHGQKYGSSLGEAQEAEPSGLGNMGGKWNL